MRNNVISIFIFGVISINNSNVYLNNNYTNQLISHKFSLVEYTLILKIVIFSLFYLNVKISINNNKYLANLQEV